MNMVDKLFAATAEIWKSYNEHTFVLSIQNGTLVKEMSPYYMIQDYLYLEDYFILMIQAVRPIVCGIYLPHPAPAASS